MTLEQPLYFEKVPVYSAPTADLAPRILYYQETPVFAKQAVSPRPDDHPAFRDASPHGLAEPPSYTSVMGSSPAAGSSSSSMPRTVREHSNASNQNVALEKTRTGSDSSIEMPRVPSKDVLPLPCVIPQTSKAYRGAIFSPFVRAYVPQLAKHGIKKNEFVAFIDGLNEAFFCHPALQGLTVLTGVLSMTHVIGIGLHAAAGGAALLTSYLRTKAYVRAMNADLFHPAGLHLAVMTTKRMMSAVGHTQEKLQLPPLQGFGDVDGAALSYTERLAQAKESPPEDDPRMRRVKALQGYVMPLDFNVPAEVKPDNLLKKMSASEAARSGKRHEKRMQKMRDKGHEGYVVKLEKAVKRQLEGDRDIAKIEEKLAQEQETLGRAMANGSQKEREKATRKFEKEEKKLQKCLQKETEKCDKDVAKERKNADKKLTKVDKKETKVANSIRWIVITKLRGDEAEHDGDSDSNELSDSNEQ